MKRRRRTKRGTLRAIRLWTYPEAAKALPYLRSITNSLRDHWLELQSQHLAARRLGEVRKPSRQQRISLAETQNDLSSAENKFETALADGVPEPGLVMYGVVRNTAAGNARVTSGTLSWTFTTSGGGVTVLAPLQNLNGQFSFPVAADVRRLT